MLKKILAGTMVFLIIGVMGAVGYAADGETINNSTSNKTEAIQSQEEKAIEVFLPEDNFTTSEKIVLLSGRAKEGSNVILEIYSTASLSTSSFTLSNLPKEENYILILTDKIEMGQLGNFARELELKPGVNKIRIYLKNKDEISNIITRYIYVTKEAQAKKALDNFNEVKFSDTINQLIKN